MLWIGAALGHVVSVIGVVITISPVRLPGEFFFEWVGDGRSRHLLIAQAWNVLIAVVFRWTLRILITNKGVLKRNFDLHFNESVLTLFTYSAARWLKGLTVANKHINKCFGDRGKETLTNLNHSNRILVREAFLVSWNIISKYGAAVLLNLLLHINENNTHLNI